ncbi:MAG: DUF4065 domain-containing protein [Vagococcus sp.]|uniref:Panacea domain-containing protein n=1 Tax=Vagococcus sp. TaxID=1933889 RepID=UPI002FC9B455
MNEFVSFDAIDIANYFVYKAEETNNSEKLNNLKLQKILYYSYAFFTEGALFKDTIEKWKLGPVVPEVYHSFKHNGSQPIKGTVTKLDLENFELVDFKGKVLEKIEGVSGLVTYLNEIFDLLISKNPFTIVDKTHSEEMWKSNELLINQGIQHLEYTDSEIKQFFSNKEKSCYLGI